MNRPTWKEYFMQMAFHASKRSTCIRRQVGAIIVSNNTCLSTGYNGAPKGLAHCEETDCIREKENIPSGEKHELCRGVHAEQNAIIQAAVNGVSINGGTIFTTVIPCSICTKMIINAGIKKIIYSEGYNDELSYSLLKESGIITERFET